MRMFRVAPPTPLAGRRPRLIGCVRATSARRRRNRARGRTFHAKQANKRNSNCSAPSRRPTVKLTNDSNRQNGYRAHVRREGTSKRIEQLLIIRSVQSERAFQKQVLQTTRDSHPECEC